MRRTVRIAALSKWENAKQLRLRNEVVKSIIFDRFLRARQWLKVAKFTNFIREIYKHTQKKIQDDKIFRQDLKRRVFIQRLFRSVFGNRGLNNE